MGTKNNVKESLMADGEYTKKEHTWKGRGPPQGWASDLVGEGVIAAHQMAEKFSGLSLDRTGPQSESQGWWAVNCWLGLPASSLLLCAYKIPQEVAFGGCCSTHGEANRALQNSLGSCPWRMLHAGIFRKPAESPLLFIRNLPMQLNSGNQVGHPQN